MPIYEYTCDACGHTFEAKQKISEKPLTKCTRCEGPAHRVISAPALLFKGSGWYVTDYANPERKKAMEAEKGPSTEKSSSGDGASDKTEKKSTPKNKKKTTPSTDK